MDIREIRRINLETLIAEAGTAAELARVARTSNDYLSTLRARDGRPSPLRAIGSALARKLERAAGKPDGWMDQLYNGGPKSNGHAVRWDHRSVAHLRLIEWPAVTDHRGENPMRKWKGPTVESSITPTARTFATRVPGDQMTPEFPLGCTIVVEPKLKPADGDFVIVELKAGELPIFRQLVFDGRRRFLRPLNQSYPVVELHAHSSVVGVVREQIKRYR